MASTRWQPWQDYADEPEVLAVFEPPCKFCKYWRPCRVFEGERTVMYAGVRMCHTPDEQARDFSCFAEDLRK